MLRGVGGAVAVAAAAALVAGCGSEGGTPNEGSSAAVPGSAEAVLARPGPDIVLTPGTSDYGVGGIRVSFLVVDSKGRTVERPRARVWVARSLKSPPLLRTTARLERIGAPGKPVPEDDVSRIYVTRFRLGEPGHYVLVAEPVGGRRIQGALELDVKEHTEAAAVGSTAYPSHTPTVASTGGDLKALTTQRPPDVSLLRYSVADSLAKHAPFVLVFATPAFCQSRACGPVVDVAEYVRRRLARTPVRFIHVEIYEHNQPPNVNRWVKEWKLPTEPWTFLVGRDGVIEAAFEGSVSAAELESAVRAQLLG